MNIFKKSLLLLAWGGVAMGAVNFSSPLVASYENNLYNVLENKSLDSLNTLKFTEQDVKFISEMKNLTTEKISSVGFDGLSQYAPSINGIIEGDLTNVLTQNSLDFNGFQKILDNSFLEGYKSEALAQIGALNFDDLSKKIGVMNELSSMKDLGSISDFLGKQEFELVTFDTDGLKQIQKYVPQQLKDAADGIEKALSLTKNSFDCVCAGVLNKAFSDIQKYIIEENLNPIYANLRVFKTTIEDNIKIAKSQEPLITRSNKAYAAKILEARKILAEMNKLKNIHGK